MPNIIKRRENEIFYNKQQIQTNGHISPAALTLKININLI
jgi:hypothetical protein